MPGGEEATPGDPMVQYRGLPRDIRRLGSVFHSIRRLIELTHDGRPSRCWLQKDDGPDDILLWVGNVEDGSDCKDTRPLTAF